MTPPLPVILVPITVVAMREDDVIALERYRARADRPGWRAVASGKARQEVVEGAQRVIDAARNVERKKYERPTR